VLPHSDDERKWPRFDGIGVMRALGGIPGDGPHGDRAR
jgi:hypothetical protein